MYDYTLLNVLYEDNHVIVVEKPAQILSQADGTSKQDMLTLVKEYIKIKYQKPGNVYLGLVHRLDFNVGGVMVFAKTSKAASRLSEAIRVRDITKEYYAVLEADLPIGQKDVLQDYIAKDEINKMAYVTDESKGKHSSLEYEVIDSILYGSKKLSLVRVNLLSGRFHQIRLQFSSRNMPLYGDIKYGHRTREKDRELGLFAYKLTFVHPITQNPMTFTVQPTSSVFQTFESMKNRE